MSTIGDILMIKGPDVIVADPEATVDYVAKLMAQANVGSVVIRKDHDVLGIFTERDLLKRVVAKGRDPAATPIREVMTSPVTSCRLADSVDECCRTLTEGNFRHLVVLEEGALVGMVGLRDVMAARLSDSQD